VSAPHPWLESIWSRLWETEHRGQLSHAIMLRGRAGFGKRDFARAFISSLLCTAPKQDTACGQCRSCGLLVAGSHPDFLKIAPEEAGKSILIDHIRDLGRYFALRPHYGLRKIALIEPADAMNRAAANALLKILEEPPSAGMMVLVADRPERLPATVRSRCQQYSLDLARTGDLIPENLDIPSRKLRAETLARAGGSPLRVKDFSEPGLAKAIDALPEAMAAVLLGSLSPLSAAAQFAKIDLVLIIDQCLRLLHEALLLKNEASVPLAEAGRAPHVSLQKMVLQLDSRKLAAFVQKLYELKQLRLSSGSLRELDLAESLWFDWRQAA